MRKVYAIYTRRGTIRRNTRLDRRRRNRKRIRRTPPLPPSLTPRLPDKPGFPEKSFIPHSNSYLFFYFFFSYSKTIIPATWVPPKPPRAKKNNFGSSTIIRPVSSQETLYDKRKYISHITGPILFHTFFFFFQPLLRVFSSRSKSQYSYIDTSPPLTTPLHRRHIKGGSSDCLRSEHLPQGQQGCSVPPEP